MTKTGILFINNTSVIGGAEKVILDIIKSCQHRGVEVGVASSLHSRQWIGLVRKSGGKVFKLETGEESERWHGLNLINPFMVLYLFRIASLIKRVSSRYKKVQILVQLYKEQILSGLALRDKGIPLIWVQHPHPPRWLRCSPLRYIYVAVANRYVSMIITGSDSVKKALVRIGIIKDKIKVIPNGIEIPRTKISRYESEFCKWYDISEDTIIISTHGRLHYQKGQMYLLKAIKELIGEFPSIKLIIMGEGRYRSYLEQMTLSLGLTGHVIFTGYYPNIGEILSITDVWISPSLREGFSLSVLEAMSYGLPVVATACGGTEELIADGCDGYLIPPRDVKAMVMAVRDILYDRERARVVGEMARKKIEGHYYLNRYTDEFLSAIGIERYEESCIC